MKLNYIIFLLLPFVLNSCLTTSGGGDNLPGAKPMAFDGKKTYYLTGKPQWNKIADAKKVFDSGVTIKGNEINLNGNRLSGKKLKHPSDPNNENAQELKITFDNLHLTNGNIDDIPGGIVLRGNNARLSKLTFTTRGEDFVSTLKDTVSGTRIENCKFYNTRGDKSIQLNAAKDAKITGCYITGGQTGIRLQESTSKTKGIKCEVSNTTFDRVPTAINVDGYTTVTLKGNTYKGVGEKVRKGSNAKVKNL